MFRRVKRDFCVEYWVGRFRRLRVCVVGGGYCRIVDKVWRCWSGFGLTDEGKSIFVGDGGLSDD